MQKLHVIYIPGLGDENPSGQRKAVASWCLWGVEAELFQMVWSDDIAWEAKFQRLLDRIDELAVAGKRIGLVGASAGASVAINAFAARKDKVAGVALIAGKVNRPEAVGEFYHQRYPSFIDSLEAAQASLQSLSDEDRSRILSRYAVYDERVSKADSIIPGATNQARYIPGHVSIIATQIFLGASSFLRFLKKQT